MEYNGHKSWNHWNSSLWLNNDEELHGLVLGMNKILSKTKHEKRLIPSAILEVLQLRGHTTTPDGGYHTEETIELFLADYE